MTTRLVSVPMLSMVTDTSSPARGTVHSAWTSPTLDGAIYAEPLIMGGRVYVANSRLPGLHGTVTVRNRAPFAGLEVTEIAPQEVWAVFDLRNGVYEIEDIYPALKQ